MRANHVAALVAGVLMISFSGNASAADKSEFGKREYESNCAACHGKQGKGDGPYAGILDKRIPDLTILARTHNGVFPFTRVQEVIDGREWVAAHGSRDMPIWGDRYLAAARESLFDVPYDAEKFVGTRVVALTEYIERLQATAASGVTVARR